MHKEIIQILCANSNISVELCRICYFKFHLHRERSTKQSLVTNNVSHYNLIISIYNALTNMYHHPASLFGHS